MVVKMKKIEPRERARMEILNYVIQFLTTTWYGQNKTFVMEDQSFHNCGNNPPIGSIVRLFCAPNTKWYLSWVIDKRDGEVLLESIEDGATCWWSNVGYFYIPLKKIKERPTWKYTDRQFEFKDKWFRACDRCYDYNRIALLPKFLENGNVMLGVRKKWIDDSTVKKEFKNWKTLKSRDMQEFFKNVEFKSTVKDGREI
tara:strand:- start:6303 stop:6899 length:597 start_codon:yes stop_codon:yes gene_type:complete